MVLESLTYVAMAALQTLVHACGVLGVCAQFTQRTCALLLVLSTLLTDISACQKKIKMC